VENNWDRVLEKLDKHSELLSAIVVEISTLKNGDVNSMNKYESLDSRVRNLEQRLALASVVGAVITFVAAFIAYKLK